ncbi:MAG: HAMP domain-containing histidine kinase, partial [Burkholderiaceae bacterium]|nr:HAMP domain-containing histidine kinase [Burkholderiaceae bacterium]
SGAAVRDSARRGEWLRHGDGGHAYALRLDDGRVLVTSRAWRSAMFGRPPLPGVVTTMVLIALAIGIGAYPVVRRLTRRLEKLQATVERLGAGELDARVEVSGRDEVAALAESFNRSAQRIEALVNSHKTLLANASHELRSPLARIRMAIELIGPEAPAATRAELARNVAELDQLVDEILLASRLDATTTQADAARSGFDEVDLTAIAAEEAARTMAQVRGEPITVRGDALLLRRLVRNLLENAQRHGRDAEVELSVCAGVEAGAGGQAMPGARAGTGSEARTGDGQRVAILSVCDRGPGVARGDRERIFEPFYRACGASERQGGVGLGLALVRQIAAHPGGTVSCEERDGGGSCFVARLPLTQR